MEICNQKVKIQDLNLLVKIAKRKLFVLELDKTLLSFQGNIPSSTWEIVYSILKNNKKIVLISNKHKDLIKSIIETSLKKYLNKQNLSPDCFKDILLYTDGGGRKYVFNSGKFKEIKDYCKNLGLKDIDKIRSLIENHLANNEKRESVSYQKEEEFDIYNLTNTEKKNITEKLKEHKSRNLIKAIEEVLQEPKIMVNLSESPTLYYLMYGLMDRTYYARNDPEYKKRLELVSKIKNLLKKEKINAKVELGGSRGIAIRAKTKEDALKDAISTLNVNKNEVLVIMDAFELAENSKAMIFTPEIALINIGDGAANISNNELYEKYFHAHIGAVAWLVLMNLICSDSFKQKDLEFLKKVLVAIKELLIQPEIRSKTIAENMNISKEELINIFNFISNYDALRNLLRYNSRFPSYTIPMFGYIKYKKRIKKIITGKTVYPLIVEMHLSEECNSNCVMCFSRDVEYEEGENNRKLCNLDKAISIMKELSNQKPDFDLIKERLKEFKELNEFNLCPFELEKIVKLIEDCKKEGVKKYSNIIQQELTKLNKVELETLELLINKDAIEKLLTNCKKGGVKEIWFSGGKEPLMSPAVIDTIKKANEMGFSTRLYTNGELLDTEEKRKAVLGCFQVRFSINGSNNETYDKIHFPGNRKYPCLMHHREGNKVFEKVRENIRELVKLKQKTGAKVKIAMSQIIQPINCGELINFVNLAYSLGIDSIQIRAESSGTIRSFTEDEKKKIVAQIYEINRRENLGQFGSMEFDLRGVTKEELDASKDTTQFLPGMKKAKLCMAGAFKRGVNPYGKIYNCEFSMHPQNARIEPYKSKRIGDLHKNNFGRILSNAAGKYPFMCNKPCQAHEYAMNITLEKFMDDYEWGISINDQPYYKNKEIALVGLGRWGGGPVLNTLTQFQNIIIHGVTKFNYDEWLNKKDLPQNFKIHSAESYEEEILSNQNIKTVIITTPFNTHYDLVKQALLAGKNVFVEKPFTKTVKEAEELIKIAKEKGRILAVGHEFMYDQSINSLKEIIKSETLGKIINVEFNMLNPLEGRKLDTSSNVIEDLATHMLSLVQLLFGKKQINELKVNIAKEKASISFDYEGTKMKINVDRDYQENERDRTIKIKGTNLHITLDYQNGKFKVQDTNGKIVNNKYPINKNKSTLELEFKAFLEAVKNHKNLVNNAENILWIYKFTDQIAQKNK